VLDLQMLTKTASEKLASPELMVRKTVKKHQLTQQMAAQQCGPLCPLI
jgi:hypothetical protein